MSAFRKGALFTSAAIDMPGVGVTSSSSTLVDVSSSAIRIVNTSGPAASCAVSCLAPDACCGAPAGIASFDTVNILQLSVP